MSLVEALTYNIVLKKGNILVRLDELPIEYCLANKYALMDENGIIPESYRPLKNIHELPKVSSCVCAAKPLLSHLPITR